MTEQEGIEDAEVAEICQCELYAFTAYHKLKKKHAQKHKKFGDKKSGPPKPNGPSAMPDLKRRLPFRRKGGGRGGKGSGKKKLSLEERKAALQRLKSRTKCKTCGQTGHWAGDKACTQKTAMLAMCDEYAEKRERQAHAATRLVMKGDAQSGSRRTDSYGVAKTPNSTSSQSGSGKTDSHGVKKSSGKALKACGDLDEPSHWQNSSDSCDGMPPLADCTSEDYRQLAADREHLRSIHRLIEEMSASDEDELPWRYPGFRVEPEPLCSRYNNWNQLDDDGKRQIIEADFLRAREKRYFDPVVFMCQGERHPSPYVQDIASAYLSTDTGRALASFDYQDDESDQEFDVKYHVAEEDCEAHMAFKPAAKPYPQAKAKATAREELPPLPVGWDNQISVKAWPDTNGRLEDKNTITKHGKCKGKTYGAILKDHPEYPGELIRGECRKSKARVFAKNFLSWYRQEYPLEIHQSSLIMPPNPGQVRPRLPEKQPEPCKDGCKTFLHIGSNHYKRRYTCQVCGHVTTEDVVRKDNLLEPDACEHANTDHRGSTKGLVKTYCLDCGTYIKTVQRWEHEQIMRLVKNVQNATSAQQLNAQRVLKEFVIDASEANHVCSCFHQMLEAHFNTYTTITASKMRHMLFDAQDLIMGQPEQVEPEPSSPAVTATSSASAWQEVGMTDPTVHGGVTVNAGRLSVDSDSDSDVEPHGKYCYVSERLAHDKLSKKNNLPPKINPFTSNKSWACLDGGCNSSTGNVFWFNDFLEKFNKLKTTDPTPYFHGTPKQKDAKSHTYRGIGACTMSTVGKYELPTSIKMRDSETKLVATIEINLSDSEAKQPMLLSSQAQGVLGLVVDFQENTVFCKHTNQYVEVARCEPSGILMIALADWPRSFEDICETTRDRNIALCRIDDNVTDKSTSWTVNCERCMQSTKVKDAAWYPIPDAYYQWCKDAKARSGAFEVRTELRDRSSSDDDPKRTSSKPKPVKPDPQPTEVRTELEKRKPSKDVPIATTVPSDDASETDSSDDTVLNEGKFDTVCTAMMHEQDDGRPRSSSSSPRS